MIVCSLFDGMSCGQLAFQRAGIKIDKYFASEIDKYAIKITQKNFPNTIVLFGTTLENKAILMIFSLLINFFNFLFKKLFEKIFLVLK